MTPHRDPAALLREAFAEREGEIGSAARLGRARLTAAMVAAKTPTRHANVWAPAFAGLAAAALIGGAAFFNFRSGARVTPQTTASLQLHREAAVHVPAPNLVPGNREAEAQPPNPFVTHHAPPAPLLGHSHRKAEAQPNQPPTPNPSPLAPAIAIADGSLRLAKAPGGILVRWDGPASNRQYELRKSCLNPRAPGGGGATTLNARIRSNDGQWLDTQPDSCGGAATLYEVMEVANA